VRLAFSKAARVEFDFALPAATLLGREDAMNAHQIISQLKAERDKLDRAISALEQLGGAGTGAASRGNGRRKRRHMSAEARARIAEKMRQRWAERKKKKAA
jgi:hypothetical protein